MTFKPLDIAIAFIVGAILSLVIVNTTIITDDIQKNKQTEYKALNLESNTISIIKSLSNEYSTSDIVWVDETETINSVKDDTMMYVILSKIE